MCRVMGVGGFEPLCLMVCSVMGVGGFEPLCLMVCNVSCDGCWRVRTSMCDGV